MTLTAISSVVSELSNLSQNRKTSSCSVMSTGCLLWMPWPPLIPCLPKKRTSRNQSRSANCLMPSHTARWALFSPSVPPGVVNHLWKHYVIPHNFSLTLNQPEKWQNTFPPCWDQSWLWSSFLLIQTRKKAFQQICVFILREHLSWGCCQISWLKKSSSRDSR